MSHHLIRTPVRQLLDARQDHARCLRLAAWYRGRLAMGDASMRDRHAWAIGQARKIRSRFAGALSQPLNYRSDKPPAFTLEPTTTSPR